MFPRRMVATASACSQTDGVAGEAAVTRRPPSSGALLPISTIFPASEATAAGSSSSLVTGMVWPVQFSGGPGRRSCASGPSGAANSAIRNAPSSIISALLPRASRIASTASPGRARPPVITNRGTRRIGPSGSAAMISAPKPAAAPVNNGAGPTSPGARHSPGKNILWRDSTGVAGRSRPTAVVSRTNPSTEGARPRALASKASPSVDQRSGPASNISRAITAGFPLAAVATTRASCPRGHGQAPRRASAARSMSTITTSGRVGTGRNSRGARRSNARSLAGSRTVSAAPAQIASASEKAARPASTGHGGRWRRVKAEGIRGRARNARRWHCLAIFFRGSRELAGTVSPTCRRRLRSWQPAGADCCPRCPPASP